MCLYRNKNNSHTCNNGRTSGIKQSHQRKAKMQYRKHQIRLQCPSSRVRIISRTPKGLGSPTPPAHRTSFLGLDHPCRNPAVLAYPISQSLHCNCSFPTTASCNGLSGTLCRGSHSVTWCQASAALHSPPSLASLLSKPSLHERHLRYCQNLPPVPLEA